MSAWVDDYDLNDPIDPTPFASSGEAVCGQSARDSAGFSHLCDRDPGHSGRHMSITFEDGDTPFVLAAWPGTHAPTLEDL